METEKQRFDKQVFAEPSIENVTQRQNWDKWAEPGPSQSTNTQIIYGDGLAWDGTFVLNSLGIRGKVKIFQSFFP